MRIAISLQTNNGLDSMVAQHFGRCPYFGLVDMNDNEFQAIEVIDNPYFAGHQVGEVPQFIFEQEAKVMLTGGMGGRAIQLFALMGIQPMTGAAGTVRDTLETYLDGELRGAEPCVESMAHGHDAAPNYNHTEQKIIAALESVEHLSIAATLLDLGMLRDYSVADDQKVSLTLALPFPNIPDNVRDYMLNSLAAAVQSAGGELVEVRLALMTDDERQKFLMIEEQNWRG